MTQNKAAATAGILMLRELKRECGTSIMVMGVWIFLRRRRSLYMTPYLLFHDRLADKVEVIRERHNKPSGALFQPKSARSNFFLSDWLRRYTLAS